LKSQRLLRQLPCIRPGSGVYGAVGCRAWLRPALRPPAFIQPSTFLCD
jgi:hypothetical protein